MNGISAPCPVASRSTVVRTTAGLLLASAMMLAGCVGYSSWPPEEGSKVPSNPNFNEMRLVMTRALEWTVDRYPPGPVGRPDLETPVAINLPEGVRASMYRIIVENVADHAQPLTPDNAHLPIYHITAVTVIGDDATVNIARPVSGWGTNDPKYQGVTLELRGGMLKDWRVVAHRLWTTGAMEPPAHYYLPGSAPDEAPEEAEPAAGDLIERGEPLEQGDESAEVAPAEPEASDAPAAPEAAAENEPAAAPNAGAPSWD